MSTRNRHGADRFGRVLGPMLGLVLLLTLPLLSNADTALTYDANGNVETRTLSGGITTFGYDDLDRLNSEAGPANTQSIGYDGNDNRTSDGTGSKTYVPSTDRLATINGANVNIDAVGNVTAAHGRTYVWNQRAGQIKTVSQGGTLLATYYYDYQGRRTRKVTTASAPQGAGTTIYAYDRDGHLIAELSGTGSAQRTYVWRDEVPVAIILHGNPESVLYLETDHLGTPIAARNQQGTIVWKWESDAFGTTAPSEDPDGDGPLTTINLRFPGQYFDKESGLYYNWHRYYDPKLGRYLSPDPVGLAAGPNPFLYVKANPLSYADPDGLNPVAGAAAGGMMAGPPGLVIGGLVGLGLGLWAGNELNIFAKPSNPDPLDPAGNAGHSSGARPSTGPKHEEADARRRQDRGREAGDDKRSLPRRRPEGWRGPWPPKSTKNSCDF